MMRRTRKTGLSNIAHVAPWECRWAGCFKPGAHSAFLSASMTRYHTVRPLHRSPLVRFATVRGSGGSRLRAFRLGLKEAGYVEGSRAAVVMASQRRTLAGERQQTG
jgi:hypothetical protein